MKLKINRYSDFLSAPLGAQAELSGWVTTQRGSGSGGKEMVIPRKAEKWTAPETDDP